MSVLGLMLGAQMHPTLLFYSHCLKPDDFTCQGESAATPDARYFIILLCPMPDDFTRQEESAATQWVNPLHCTLIRIEK
jgi:hypothetical protein